MESLSHTQAWRLPCGTAVRLRPVRPGDAPGLQALVARQSPAARRNRFHAALRALPERHALQMCRIDPRSGAAFVIALAGPDGEQIVGDVRYVAEAGAARLAEFTIMVDERWQRQGLGTRGMRALVGAARCAGLGGLHGSVLAGNAPMLGLMQHCRFSCQPDPADEGLMRAETAWSADVPDAAGPARPGRALWWRGLWATPGAVHA